MPRRCLQTSHAKDLCAVMAPNVTIGYMVHPSLSCVPGEGRVRGKTPQRAGDVKDVISLFYCESSPPCADAALSYRCVTLLPTQRHSLWRRAFLVCADAQTHTAIEDDCELATSDSA